MVGEELEVLVLVERLKLPQSTSDLQGSNGHLLPLRRPGQGHICHDFLTLKSQVLGTRMNTAMNTTDSEAGS